MAGTAGRWYLCVNEGEDSVNPDANQSDESGGESEGTGGTGEGESGGGEKPGEPNQPDEPGEGENEEYKQPEEEGEPEEPKQPEEIPAPGAEEGYYCIVKFTYVDNVESGVEEFLYQDTEVRDVSSENPPWDSYVAEKGMFSNRLNAEGEADALAEASSADVDGCFEYVGGGKGRYKLTKVKVTDADLQDNEIQDADSQDADAQDRSARAAESSSKPYYVEVWNAPVYMSCSAGNDWLRQYVFNSLKAQDNASDDFTIRVDTVLAGDVTYEMVQEADLVYLEDGKGMNLQDVEGVVKSYVYSEKAEDGLEDISDNVITTLLYEAVQELKPVIVDYGIIESEDYPGSRYQKLAKAFLKKDLTAFYNAMAKSDDLAASVLMNADKDLKDFPDKTDNDFHYVNRNIYIVSGTPLAGKDFHDEMSKTEVKAGFSEVLAAIRAENVLLSDDEKISEKVSKAMAVQYIINYSLGLVGEYKDLSILELQPTANKESDLYRDANDSKGSVVLYWQRKDRDGEGQQILRSSKMIETNVTLSSVAAFNSSYQDINAEYNMIFIGLDGQRLYHDWDKDGVLSAIYNDKDLNGKVYHPGARVAGSAAR
ncbi:MAG: hypothetical protein K2N00_11025, partial [Lachnospiraceae bacterium]|nr:hypothetical protein [Lachnospiraceae bacterium]